MKYDRCSFFRFFFLMRFGCETADNNWDFIKNDRMNSLFVIITKAHKWIYFYSYKYCVAYRFRHKWLAGWLASRVNLNLILWFAFSDVIFFISIKNTAKWERSISCTFSIHFIANEMITVYFRRIRKHYCTWSFITYTKIKSARAAKKQITKSNCWIFSLFLSYS